MKWFLMLIILALSAGAIELDENLTIHSLYGSEYLLSYGTSSTPSTGQVGTNGTLWMWKNLTVNSNLYATQCKKILFNKNITVSDEDTVFYSNKSGVSFNGLGEAIQINPVYNVIPQLPILESMPDTISNLTVSGNLNLSNGNHYYNDIILNANSSIILDSGELHCNSLVFNTNTSIISDTGSLQIIIHEKKNQLSFWLSFIGIDIDVIINSDTKIIGTIIAPKSEILLKDNVEIIGQIFAKGITLQDFAGEIFKFINIKPPYVSDALFICNEHETITEQVIIYYK